MNDLKSWFFGLAQRERIAVVAGGVAVVFALFYYVLWKPMNTHLADAQVRVTAESNQARWMLGIRDEARLLQSSGAQHQLKGQGAALLTIIDSTSRANGLGDAVSHIQPENDNKATVTLEKASFTQLLFWMQSLQSDYGVAASEMTISRDDDNPGQVEARLTLSRGGA